MPAEAVQALDPRLAKFTLAAFDIGDDGQEDVEIITTAPDRPDIRKHVSLAGLYMLAILSLDADGTVEARMDDLLMDGAINEVDAANRIRLLTTKEHHDQRI